MWRLSPGERKRLAEIRAAASGRCPKCGYTIPGDQCDICGQSKSAAISLKEWAIMLVVMTCLFAYYGNEEKPPSPAAMSWEHKLASIDAGHLLPTNDPRIERYRTTLEKLRSQTGESYQDLSDAASMMKNRLNQKGRGASTIELLEGASSVLEVAQGAVTFEEALASITVLQER